MSTMHMTDAANLEILTSGATLTPEFQGDYARWLAAKHRFGASGPLGDLLVALCDKHGLLPEIRKPTAGPIDFSKIPTGRRVFVTYDGPNDKPVTEGAEFRGMAEGNMVVVLRDSKRESNWVDEFRPVQIKLDDPNAGPPPAASQPNVQPRPSEQQPRFGKFDPTEHLRDEATPRFAYRNKAISGLAGSAPIKVLRDGVAHPAQFVKHGPGDFQIAVLVEGETDLDVVDEENVLLPAPPPAPTPKKKLSGYQKRKRAAEKAAAAVPA